MKDTLRFFIAVLLSATLLAQPTPPTSQSVTATTSTGALVSPSNFFTGNQAAIAAVVGNATLTTTQIQAANSAGLTLKNAAGANVLLLGPGPGTGATFYGGITGATFSLGSNTLTGTSLQLATAISDETGSGALVFGTSPTLTTPILGAATATSITAPATTDLTLTGGSSGASLVLGSGTSGNFTATVPVSGTGVWVSKATQGIAGVPSIQSLLTIIGGTDVSTNVAGVLTLGNASNSVTTGDILGAVNFYNNDASGSAAGVRAAVSGVIEDASGRNGALVFSTGASATATGVGRFTSTGNLLIGTTTDMSGSGGVKVAGNILSYGALSIFSNGTAGAEVRTSGDGGATPFGYTWYSGTTYEADMKHTASSGVLTLSTGRNSAWGGKFDIYVDTTRSARFAKALTTFDQAVNFASTAASTNTTSGSGIFGGGIGVAGAGYFGGKIQATGNAATTEALDLITSTGAGGTAQWYAKGGSGTVTIWRMLRGNGAAGYAANGLNIDTYDAMQVGLNALGGSGGSFVVKGGKVNLTDTTSAASSTVGALTIGNGTAATNVAIGGGNVNAGGTLTVGGTVIHTLSATPASASAAGTVGTISWDSSYIYICTATNTWKRVPIATW